MEKNDREKYQLYMHRVAEEKEVDATAPIITCPFFEPMNRQTHEDKNVVRDSTAIETGDLNTRYR